MTQHRATSASDSRALRTAAAGRPRPTGVLLLGAVASGTLALGALTQAQVANATCLSVSGVGIGNGCTSTFGNIAMGVGSGAKASATGLFGTAFAIGTNAEATELGGLFGTAIAVGNNVFAGTATGLLDTALTVGASAGAVAEPGNLNAAVTLGTGAASTVHGDANVALAAGHRASSTAVGVGNYASAIGDPGTNATNGPNFPTTARAIGVFNRAAAYGNGNDAEAWSPLNHRIGNNTALVVGSGSTATVNGPLGTKTNQIAIALGKNQTAQK